MQQLFDALYNVCLCSYYIRVLVSCCVRMLVFMLHIRVLVFLLHIRVLVFMLHTCACVHAADVRLCSCCIYVNLFSCCVRVLVFMMHAYAHDSENIAYRDFYPSLHVTHLCHKCGTLRFLAYVPQIVAQKCSKRWQRLPVNPRWHRPYLDPVSGPCHAPSLARGVGGAPPAPS